MTTKQKILPKDIWVRTAETQPFFAFLSIIQNFSLGRLCKALHKTPQGLVYHPKGIAIKKYYNELFLKMWKQKRKAV